jgi:hypothetical protein
MGAELGVGVVGEPAGLLAQIGAVAADGVGRGLVEEGVDPHAEMRGVVMLAASNETVERPNTAAQAVRAAAGELGAERTYQLRAGRSLRLREGDHVLIRLNDRAQRRHAGPDVLTGYRGVVEGIAADGAVRVTWQQPAADGHASRSATLSPAFVADGGLDLGCAMTGHKAEGLTVAADWTAPDGTHQGDTVLIYSPGMDEPGLHVATSRHRDRMYLFAGRDQLETLADTHERSGVPSTVGESEQRVIAALAEQAQARSSNANDRPVHDDLEVTAGGPAAPTGGAAWSRPTGDPAQAWRDLQQQTRPGTAHPASNRTPPTGSPASRPVSRPRRVGSAEPVAAGLTAPAAAGRQAPDRDGGAGQSPQATAWARLRNRQAPARPAGAGSQPPGADRGAPRAQDGDPQQDSRRDRRAGRREEDARHPERGRGPRL